MSLRWMPCLRLSFTALAGVLALLASACGSDPTPTVAPDPPPTAAVESRSGESRASDQDPSPTATSIPLPTPSPTPEPTPTLSTHQELARLLVSVEATLADMKTARFDMVDVEESGAPFFGTTFKSLEGEVKSPDSFWMLVSVVTPGFGFVKIEMMAVGEEAYMKFSEGAPWTPLPVDQVPFNFGEIGLTLSRLVPALGDVALIGQESVGDTQTIRFEGTVSSEGMGELITGVDPGHSVTLSFWVNEDDHTLRQFRIDGRLFNDDAPETQRLLDIKGVNVAVDIQLPDIDAKQ